MLLQEYYVFLQCACSSFKTFSLGLTMPGDSNSCLPPLQSWPKDFSLSRVGKGLLAGGKIPTKGWFSLPKLLRCKVQLVVNQGFCTPAFR